MQVHSITPPGKTYIPDPGRLDLAEQADEIAYVEVFRPVS